MIISGVTCIGSNGMTAKELSSETSNPAQATPQISACDRRMAIINIMATEVAVIKIIGRMAVISWLFIFSQL